MTKKTDKKICWNCDGGISLQAAECPYCGVDVTRSEFGEKSSSFKDLGSPFQSSGQIPKPPYASLFTNENALKEEEWTRREDEPKALVAGEEKKDGPDAKKEIMALLLLLPGIVFFLFALLIFFFAQDGVLTISWNHNLAIFYCLGALPLLFFGWRTLK